MSKTILRMAFPGEISESIDSLGDIEDVRLSKPLPFDSHSEALNAPFNAGDLLLAAEVVTAIFASGTAMLTFFEQLKTLLKNSEATVKVTTTDGMKTIEVSADTNLDEIQKVISSV